MKSSESIEKRKSNDSIAREASCIHPSSNMRVVSLTPRLICSLLIPPSPLPTNSGHSGTGGSHHANVAFDGFATPSSLETAFMRQHQSRQVGNNSYGSMRSLASGRSLATSATSGNFSGSTESQTQSQTQTQTQAQTQAQPATLKRSPSFVSVTSNSSYNASQSQSQSQSQKKQHHNSYKVRQTASLALPTNPQTPVPMKIAFDEYLFVPTSDSQVLIYQILDFAYAEGCVQKFELNQNNHPDLFNRNDINSYHKSIVNNRKMAWKIQQEKEAVKPILSLGPFYMGDYKSRFLQSAVDKNQLIPASIVDISICDCEEGRTKQTSLLGNFAILTQEGDVHVYEFYSLLNTSNISKSHEGETGHGLGSTINQIKVNHMHSFHCGDIAATSLAMQRTLKRTSIGVNTATLRHHQSELRIAVGFEDGIVTEFSILERQHSFQWKGRMESPVRALAYIYAPYGGDHNMSKAGASPTKVGPVKEQLFLIVGVAQNYAEASLSNTAEEILSTCLDVVNTADVEIGWKSKFRNSRKTVSDIIDLNDFSIWPTNRVRGVDDFVIPLSAESPKRVPKRKGLQYVCGIDVFKGDNSAFSVLLTSGDVITLNYESKKPRNLCWGLKHRGNQVVLPYPSCGIGLFNNRRTSGHPQSIACCLRGGTTIILPTKTDESALVHDVVIHSLPFDATGVDDDSVRYVQGFTAGNVRARTWGRANEVESVPMPIYFQAWPNGAIDCYTCDLPEPQNETVTQIVDTDRSKRLYEILPSRDVLKDFLHLLSLDHSDLKPESLLRKASEEYKLSPIEDGDLLAGIIEKPQNVPESIYLVLQDLITGKKSI